MEYLKLMRIKHYIKNFLIFLPLFFSKEILYDLNKLIYVILGFVCFSFASSIIYIINDICDAPKDRLHETKKNRPIASGKISIKKALCLIIFLAISTIILLVIVGKKINYFGSVYIFIYMVLNLFYSFGFKNFPIVDIAILAFGFLLRLMFGGFLAGVEISNWLYLTVMSMAFYLGLGKRRNEIVKQGKAGKTRKVLEKYNKDFLDKMMYVCLGITIVFYSLWSVDERVISIVGNNYLIWTVPVVILICMKYSLIIENDSDGDPVEVLLNDKLLLLFVVLYIILLFIMLYCL